MNNSCISDDTPVRVSLADACGTGTGTGREFYYRCDFSFEYGRNRQTFCADKLNGDDNRDSPCRLWFAKRVMQFQNGLLFGAAVCVARPHLVPCVEHVAPYSDRDKGQKGHEGKHIVRDLQPQRRGTIGKRVVGRQIGCWMGENPKSDTAQNRTQEAATEKPSAIPARTRATRGRCSLHQVSMLGIT